MVTSTDSLLGVATDASRVLWRAEAAQAAAVAAFVEGRRADAVAAGRSAAGAEDARQVAVLEVAVELEQASGFVAHLVASTATLQADLPTVWAAHSEGLIDRAKARAVASARWRLHETASIERLDEAVVAYATTHTLSQLKGWLRRFVIRVERAHAERRRRDAVAQRHVTITAMDDGLSLLQALIPTPRRCSSSGSSPSPPRTPARRTPTTTAACPRPARTSWSNDSSPATDEPRAGAGSTSGSPSPWPACSTSTTTPPSPATASMRSTSPCCATSPPPPAPSSPAS